MKTFVVSAVFALVCGNASAASAQEVVERMISPPFPTDVGTDGGCYVRNAGSKPVSVTVSIHSNNGTVTQVNTCNGTPLAGGRTCVLLSSLPDSSYAACVVTALNVSKLRGTFEVRETPSIINPQLRVLVAGDLIKK